MTIIMKKKVIFLSNDNISISCLEAILNSNSFQLSALITQPDKTKGRGRRIKKSAISVWAEAHNIVVKKTFNINEEDSLSFIKKINPDILIVFSFGQLLKESILNSYLCLNIHTSLLPKYRGASPIESSLLNRDTETGISYMRMIKELDAGPVYKQFPIAILQEDNFYDLKKKMQKKISETIILSLSLILKGELTEKKQDQKKASFCKKIQKKDALLDWLKSADENLAKIKAFIHWPKAYFLLSLEKKQKRLIVSKAKKINTEELLNLDNRKNLIAKCAGDSYLQILEIIPEGKNPVNARDFINGYKNFKFKYINQ